MKNYLNVSALSLAVYFCLIFPTCGQNEGEGQWTDLFNGKDFNGWTQLGGDAIFRIEKSEIVGTSKTDTPSSFLVTKKHYDDFILEFELKIDTAMNSGIQFRSNSIPEFEEGRVHGYQLEIDPSPRAWSGGIYEEGKRGWLYDLSKKENARNAFKNGKWNHYRIKATGSSIQTWINGVPAADLEDDMTATGFIGLQVHSTKEKRPMEVRWRNIKIQEK